MGTIARHCLAGSILAFIALAAASAISAGSSLTLSWRELALIALAFTMAAVVAVALPRGFFRPIGLPGFGIADVQIRTAEIERRIEHPARADRQRRRHLWTLVPLAIACGVIVATLPLA